MKYYLSLVTFMVCLMGAKAQQVAFTIESGKEALASNANTVQNEIAALLNEINTAGAKNRDLNLSKIKSLDYAARLGLEGLWKEVHFTLDENSISTPLLTNITGYEVRDIAIKMIKDSGSGAYNDAIDRELVIDLDKKGTIIAVMLAMDKNIYKQQFIKNGKTVRDEAERREIMKFVEQFRSYYVTKDIENLRKIFSDDAIIITGSLVMQTQRGDMRQSGQRKVKYKVQDREQYLESLRKVFNSVKYIDVQFSDIKIKKNGAHRGYYGVTLKQDWKTSGYCDTGWVFLLWDFRNPERPQIHVRTWQPDEIIGNEEDIMNMSDFYLND